jgi:penicillin V acylase-like amidase (Ntn superfamily)
MLPTMSKIAKTLILAGLLAAALAVQPAAACTTVCLLDTARPVVAYNYDFQIGQGMVLINKRGLEKASSIEKNPARWTSLYGSVTFVQFGRDNPMSGMNEAGLVVSQMWLDEARYEAPDTRPAIGVLEWMQYLLDTSASVEEALAKAAGVRIVSRVPLHYLIADSSGAAAVVEFLDGERVARKGGDLPHPALANSSYGSSLAFLDNRGESAGGTSSLARFARAARAARVQPAVPIGHAFATLADVAQPGYTRWSIVYELLAREVYWRSEDNAAIRSVKLLSFDLACASPVLVLDVHEGAAGDVSAAFRDFDPVAHEQLVVSAYAGTSFLSSIDPEIPRREAHLAENSVCAP